MLAISSQAGWLRGQVATPKAAVWPNRVVVNPPSFDDDLGFFQHIEQFRVEKLIAYLPVERFTAAILIG